MPVRLECGSSCWGKSFAVTVVGSCRPADHQDQQPSVRTGVRSTQVVAMVVVAVGGGSLPGSCASFCVIINAVI